MLTVKIQYLTDDAKTPVRGSAGAAGWDVFAICDGVVHPGDRERIPLGFAIELPEGWTAKLKQRSGLFLSKGIIINDSPIDSDYRGEVLALAKNTSGWSWYYYKGERIGQLLFERVPEVEFVTVDVLSATERGVGATGSTGK